MAIQRKLEIRSMPTLLEQRNNLLTEMESLLSKAKTETRSFSDEEQTRFNEIKDNVLKIDKTMESEKQAEEMRANQAKTNLKSGAKTEAEEKRMLAEEKFVKFVKGDTRALDVGGNGSIIPQEIADRIVTRVRELSPIYQRATVFNVGGDLVFPQFDITSITAGYIADMTALTPQNGNFTTLKLQNFIAGALVQISRSLLNRQDFDLVSYVVNWMGQSFAAFMEREMLVGAGTTAATGIFTDANVTSVTAAGTTSVTLDDIITTQITIPQQLQDNAVWIMHKTLFSALRKMKDTQGYPLLNHDVTGPFGWTLLGKPLFISENAPSTMTTGSKVLVYGDLSGYYVKLAQDVQIQVLNELYSTSYATGVVGHVEFDARVIEDQKIAVLKLA